MPVFSLKMTTRTNSFLYSKLFKLIIYCTLSLGTYAINIDTDVFSFSGNEHSYFGYSVSFLQNSNGYWVIVGAPKSNSTQFRNVNEPGEIFKCDIQKQGNCSRLELNTQANNNQRNDNGWLGVSLDTQSKHGKVLACAHLTKNYMYKPTGSCYIIDKEFNTETQKTLTGKPTLYVGDQLGSSACFVKDSGSILQGMPNYIATDHKYYIAGAAAYLNEQFTQGFTFQPRTKWRFPHTHYYAGYAVTSGRFYQTAETQYVTGAPRADYIGKIFMFKSVNHVSAEQIYEHSGEQMGEYFGAALCAADLNGDDLDDLLVGAPMHSRKYEEGKVYVLINKKNGLFEPLKHGLTGSETPGSRFGSSIALIGDLNMDGFLDVAIGAPYENEHGAVYVYHGGPDGPKFRQKIVESSRSVRGFGMSIARGMDIDANNIPDIAIGAFLSSQVFVYRSRPLVTITGKLNPDKNFINTDDKRCKFNGEDVCCFIIDVDISGIGKFVSFLDIDMILMVDTFNGQESDSRVLIKAKDTNDRKQRMQWTVRLEQNRKSEKFQYEVHVPDIPKDYMTPINIRLSYEMKDASKTKSEFCATCPITDPTNPKEINSEVLFKTRCGDDQNCDTDLKVKASFPGYNSNDTLIIGAEQELSFHAEMHNSAEPAYGAMLLVTIPDSISVQNRPPFCDFLQRYSNILRCNMANPLDTLETATLDLTFSLEKMSAKQGNITINVTAYSQSNEVQNLTDNTVLVQLLVKPMADIFVLGSTEYGQIFYDGNENSDVANVTWMFEVSNNGPSFVDQANLTVHFPAKTLDGDSELIHITSINVLNDPNSEALGNCINIPSRQPQDSSTSTENILTNMTNVNCNTSLCHSVKCLIGNLGKDARLGIEISAEANMSNIMQLVGKENHERGYIFINAHVTNIEGIDQPKNHLSDYATISIEIKSVGRPPAEAVPPWIIIGSVCGGLLLFIILTLSLIKVGFFRRPIKEELEIQKRKTLLLNQINDFTTSKDIEEIF